MSLLPGVLLGVQTPQIVHLPPDVHSLAAATECIDLASSFGLHLDESQQFTIRAGMGERLDGSWAASDVVDIEARQNGKGDTMIARQMFGLFLAHEELQIATAHEFPTANESFLRLVAWIEGCDELRRKVLRVRYANGEQGVEMRDGCRLKYRARTGGGGRGFAGVSTIYYDEALYLLATHMAASGPALATYWNGQTWYASSGGLRSSQIMHQLRRRALKGDAGRLAYCEHTAEVVSLDDAGRLISVAPDPDDRDAWARANPTLGDRISEETIEGERGRYPVDVFMRERLTVWDAEEGEQDRVWPSDVWAAVCPVDARGVPTVPDPSGPVWIGVDQSPAGTLAAVAVAGGGSVRMVEPRPTPLTLVDTVVRLSAGLANAPVVLNPAGPAGWMLPDLAKAGVPVIEVTGKELRQACGFLFAAVAGARVRVVRNPSLDAAVMGAMMLPQGDAWVWGRKGSADVCPLYAMTLAWWSAAQAPEPAKPMFVY
jgi:hypothetical protein